MWSNTWSATKQAMGNPEYLFYFWAISAPGKVLLKRELWLTNLTQWENFPFLPFFLTVTPLVLSLYSDFKLYFVVCIMGRGGGAGRISILDLSLRYGLPYFSPSDEYYDGDGDDDDDDDLLSRWWHKFPMGILGWLTVGGGFSCQCLYLSSNSRQGCFIHHSI